MYILAKVHRTWNPIWTPKILMPSEPLANTMKTKNPLQIPRINTKAKFINVKNTHLQKYKK